MKTKEDNRVSDRLYDSNLNLEDRKERTKKIIQAYNHLYISEADKRNKILHQLFARAGANMNIEQPFFCFYGDNINIGKNFYANQGCIFSDEAEITIGDNVLLGANVEIYTINKVSEKRQIRPVTIGNDVWIGGNVKILPGVTIGENSIIVSGSVVAENIPANVIAFGNPAKVIKEIVEIDEAA